MGEEEEGDEEEDKEEEEEEEEDEEEELRPGFLLVLTRIERRGGEARPLGEGRRKPTGKRDGEEKRREETEGNGLSRGSC